MVLHEGGMAQLDSDGVVDDHKDEQKRVGHEVFLAIVAKIFPVLARLLIHLDRLHVDWLVAHEGNTEPDGHPAPEAGELDQQVQQVHVLNLGWQRVAPGLNDFDEAK